MSAQTASSIASTAAAPARTVRRRVKRPWMNELQTQAYLVARDTLRRVGRTSPRVGVTPPSPQERR